MRHRNQRGDNRRHTAIMNFVLMKQYAGETNDAYLTRFKSMISTLNIAGGEHIFVSKQMLKKELKNATNDKINEGRDRFAAICFILRRDESTYRKILEGLKSSANIGRDEYPQTLTDAFDLLVRESGHYDSMIHRNQRGNNRG